MNTGSDAPFDLAVDGYKSSCWDQNLKGKLKNAVAEDAGHINAHGSLLLSLSKEADQGGSVHGSLEDLASTEDEEAVEETKEAEGDQGEEDRIWQGVSPVGGVLWQFIVCYGWPKCHAKHSRIGSLKT